MPFGGRLFSGSSMPLPFAIASNISILTKFLKFRDMSKIVGVTDYIGAMAWRIIVPLQAWSVHFQKMKSSYPKLMPRGGYHSSRRVPNRESLNATIIPLYKQLLAEEAKHGGPKEGLAASCAFLAET